MYFCYGLQIAIYPNSIEADQAAKYYTPTRFPAAIRFSLSDASILQQAANAVAHVASSQAVESAVAGFDHFHIVAS